MSKQINKIYNEKLHYRMKINTLQAEIRELERKVLELKEKNKNLHEENKKLYQENNEITEKFLTKANENSQLQMENFSVMNLLYRQRRTLNSYETLKEKMEQEGIISMDSAAELIKNLEDENVDLLELMKVKF